MSTTTSETTTWIARGAAGTVGTIHRESTGFRVRVFRDESSRGPFATLETAQNALRAALGPGADRRDFIAY